ncbi:MAG TPA: cysteine--1-D-myo-inosityl 2-amino-2-deoxy-alpha-D-glucopyranoside ligase [Streptosporangiaceae bacterium]
MDSWLGARVPELPGRGPETLVTDTASGGLAVAAAGPEAKLYACGITPYDATHVGHAATYIAWDLLVRAWRDAGHHVIYVQNVTDVDDPLLERAARDGEDWRELADREIALFRGDMTALRVLPPAYYIGAVESLPVIERFSGLLADQGVLYELDGDVYQTRSADPRFGTVSGLDNDTMAELFAERGGDPGRPGKKDPLDPLVWLAARPGEPSWPSGFGPGRPGWHVECAAIATEYLGVRFDVQAGGTDLVFPHHEMSALHARAAQRGAGGGGGDGPAFARVYMHAGMVRLGGEKMSKSLGNLVFVSGLLRGGADPMAIRLALLAHHYRRDWDWTEEGLAGAMARLGRWRAAVAAASAAPGGPGPDAPGPAATIPAPSASGAPDGPVPAAGDVLAAVRARLADDLDVPGALAAVDAWADAVLAGSGPAAAGPGPKAAGLVRDTVDALLGVAL